MAIQEFRDFGAYYPSFDWGITAIVWIGIFVVKLLKRRPMTIFYGFGFGYLVCALFRLPIGFNSAVTICSIIVGVQFDATRRFPPELAKKAKGALVAAPIFIVAYCIFAFFSARNLILSDAEARFDAYNRVQKVSRAKIFITVWPSEDDDKGSQWDFYNEAGDFKFSDNDVFIQSNGEIFNGRNLGLRIAKWAGVKPQFIDPTDPRANRQISK